MTFPISLLPLDGFFRAAALVTLCNCGRALSQLFEMGRIQEKQQEAIAEYFRRQAELERAVARPNGSQVARGAT